MSTICFRVSEEEKRAIENFSKILNKSTSDMIKEIIFDKLEEEIDLEIVKNYELEDGKNFLTHEEMKNKYEL